VGREGDGEAVRHIALAGGEEVELDPINPVRANHRQLPSNVISVFLLYIYNGNYNYV
jgi:hypothetical protein